MTLKLRAVLFAFLSACACGAAAQTYPTRAITIVVPFSAGGAVDFMARLIASKMSEAVEHPVIVDNRAGAGGVIGMNSVAKAAPDGYTILYTPNSIAIGPALFRKLPFDPVKDLAPVTLATNTALMLAVHPKVPANTVQELIALARSKPGGLNFGSSGVADPLQLTVELLQTSTGISMVPIPYKGQAPMLTALLAGQVDLAVMSLALGLPHARGGTLRVLAMTGARRSPELPDVPTVAESGLPGFEASSWHGMFVPAGTPRDIVNRIQRETAKILNAPEARERITALGSEIVASTPEEFEARFKSDVAKFKMIVKNANIPFQD